MRYERTNRTLADTVSIAEMAEHLRLDDDLVLGAMAYTDAAAAEIEAYSDLALLDQDIIATTGRWPGQDIDLPVGPAPSDATVTVELIEQDGTTTEITTGFWFEGGSRPRLHFTTTPGGTLRITYGAGYGSGSSDIPADLRMAICDLAARLYDYRASDKHAPFPAATARIAARYRRVRIDA